MRERVEIGLWATAIAFSLLICGGHQDRTIKSTLCFVVIMHGMNCTQLTQYCRSQNVHRARNAIFVGEFFKILKDLSICIHCFYLQHVDNPLEAIRHCRHYGRCAPDACLTSFIQLIFIQEAI
jgi:hypothetical protein